MIIRAWKDFITRLRNPPVYGDGPPRSLVWIDLSWQQNVKVISCRTFLPWADMTLWPRPSRHPHTVYLRENKCLCRSSNDFFPHDFNDVCKRLNKWISDEVPTALDTISRLLKVLILPCVVCSISTACQSSKMDFIYSFIIFITITIIISHCRCVQRRSAVSVVKNNALLVWLYVSWIYTDFEWISVCLQSDRRAIPRD